MTNTAVNYPRGQAPQSGQRLHQPSADTSRLLGNLAPVEIIEGEPVVIDLPWPPSVNGYWEASAYYLEKPQRSRSGKTMRKLAARKVLSERAREFRKEAIAACIDQGVYLMRLDGPLMAELFLFPPKNFSFDVDNYRKGVWDALTHAGVWHDDNQIEFDPGRKGSKVPGGKAVIRISRIRNPHSAHNQPDLLEATS